MGNFYKGALNGKGIAIQKHNKVCDGWFKDGQLNG